MKKPLLLLLALSVAFLPSMAQGQSAPDTSWKKIYRATPTRINNLVHTKLDVRPDYNQQWLYGKATLTLRPHFYPTDSLTLDAKGMEIKKVSLVSGNTQTPLKFDNNDWQLRIKLGKTFLSNQTYTVYIEYIAKPKEFEDKYKLNQMLGMRGMYFINPKGEEKDKPTQIWTQGETESSSVWFPTIDHTAQKTTQELTVTVPNKYVTLSNGKLTSQKKNTDGTRSDTWKMDLPHSPYLFFLGVGEYSVIKDSWKGKEVSYYVEPEYAPVARRIFGNTPEMMTYFSKITGVEYPWNKYAQITGRDYMAGAMENTTATIHQESAQQDARELADGNHWEETIAHELFHHWFGDLVTAESWSNLTLNESFANYSQTLWDEYKYGQDAGDEENFQSQINYLNSGLSDRHLVRFHYSDKEEMFDPISYQKGGRILHMLRNYIGDSAFFKSMKLYLNTYKFKAAEAHQWRQIAEEVTGRDLNWFFNQWYFNNGHPEVEINYTYDDTKGEATVVIKQNQKSGKLFTLPLAIDIFEAGAKKRHQVWASQAVDSFSFSYKQRPDLINVDADKITLWAKKDNKTAANFLYQMENAGKYMDRREAIIYASRNIKDATAQTILSKGLQDRYHGIRQLTLEVLDLSNADLKKAVEPALAKIAASDKYALVRSSAIQQLGQLKNAAYADLYRKATRDSSYSVAGAALLALSAIEEEEALKIARELNKQKSKGLLNQAIMSSLAKSGDASIGDIIFEEFEKLPVGQGKFNYLGTVVSFLEATQDPAQFKKGIDGIIKFREAIPAAYRQQTDPYINEQLLAGLLKTKVQKLSSNPGSAEVKEQIEYLKSVLPAELKKAF